MVTQHKNPQAQRSIPELSVRLRDPAEAREMGGRVYYPHRVNILGDVQQFRMSIEAAPLGPLTLGWLTYGTPVRIQTGELGRYHVNVLTAGTMVARSGGREVAGDAGVGSVYRPDRTADFETWETPAPMLALKIDPRALERHLESLLDHPISGPIDFALGFDVSSGSGMQWWGFVRSLATDLKNEESLLRDPRFAPPAVHAVLTGLLLSSRHPYRDELLRPASVAVGSRPVQDAQAYIRENASEPLTVVEIAQAAGVGVRNLQYAFRRATGLTPLEYLRSVRLEEAHRALLAADPQAGSVTEIAKQCGFAHIGRFAAVYRERYGVLPRESLARPRR